MHAVFVMLLAAGIPAQIAPAAAMPTRDAVAEAHSFISAMNVTDSAAADARLDSLRHRREATPVVEAQEALDGEQHKSDPNDLGKQEVHRLFSEQASFFNRLAAGRTPK